MIKINKEFTKKFDDCSKMGDGNQVMNHIIDKARIDATLAQSLIDKKNYGLGRW
jgi:hypothetical protein